jgi:hypothetical protein
LAGEDAFYSKAVFSKTVELVESNGKAVAVDINENNVAFGYGARGERGDQGEDHKDGLLPQAQKAPVQA